MLEAKGKRRGEAESAQSALGVRQSWSGVTVKVETKQKVYFFLSVLLVDLARHGFTELQFLNQTSQQKEKQETCA